jgi:phenylalanyl-tRNA synthetase alpha chain
MSDTLESISLLEQHALAELGAAQNPAALDAWKAAYLGSSGKVKGLLAGLKDVPKEQRPEFGKRANALQGSLTAALESRQQVLGVSSAPAAGTAKVLTGIDVTEPGLAWSVAPGRRHIITRVVDELTEVFARMGFEVARGPELEDDEHNFIKLNIPPAHPAHDPIDNFYIDERTAQSGPPRMLRSQTSTVQIRVMETRKPPIRVISPGRVYRPDTVDATHSFMFHQIEGLVVDRGVTMADLKSVLLHFARNYFGPTAEIRLRPSYFPFTEPSAELDLKIRLRPDQPERWMELGGCGMVDPAVFGHVGIDPEEFNGFAFGFGIERIVMGKYGIPDIRMLFENDLRFLDRV